MFKYALVIASAAFFFSQTTAGYAADEKTAGNSAVVGKWEWKLDGGPADGKASMQVEEVQGKLVATLTGPDGESIRCNDFKFKKGKVSFSAKRDMGPFEMVLSHSGKVQDDEITGTFKMSGGPFRKSGKWKAKRVVEE